MHMIILLFLVARRGFLGILRCMESKCGGTGGFHTSPKADDAVVTRDPRRFQNDR